ncbi:MULTISPECIES: ABC transporter ATP-binding protein [Acinetobacter]|uniref:ABC transporter ATP-binding protein n=1 Tax=Acinetobacter TaxID=469 RepID=UPI001F4B0879|nr:MULTISPECIES: ABC transporter ATP-binding protein [Acinetobacter]MCH7296874.1 ABC transporter ATP-binding protein [Acinetobacter higginsii]MCI3880170.1 ABC transporter ATP-binding protein [Acinetobacter higginsii]MCU4576370.1 ABC transporter ATP-binding protein [Acinetobacter courvalinii]
MTSLNVGSVKINHLNKSYGQYQEHALTVLDDISLEIKAGEFVSIVGSSGCGKSTLLRLLVGLDDQFEGKILVDGQPIQGTSLERGIVFQDHRLFPWLNVQDNIRVALLNRKLTVAEQNQLIDEHIELVGLTKFKDAYPAQLSGGMSQRVAIARSLINRPKILLLDEPFGALDALTRANLQKELQRIWQTEKITMIIVTHDVEEAVFLGDRVVVMQPNPGRIKRIVPVHLPHPRVREDVRLAAIRNDILTDFSHAVEDHLIIPVVNDFNQFQFAW